MFQIFDTVFLILEFEILDSIILTEDCFIADDSRSVPKEYRSDQKFFNQVLLNK